MPLDPSQHITPDFAITSLPEHLWPRIREAVGAPTGQDFHSVWIPFVPSLWVTFLPPDAVHEISTNLYPAISADPEKWWGWDPWCRCQAPLVALTCAVTAVGAENVPGMRCPVVAGEVHLE